MWLGYNTNGFAHHRLDDAIRILADLGYEGVAITLDYYSLNPFDPHIEREAERIRTLLEQLHMRSVIETGSRFLLDPQRKHQPTLISSAADDRAKRISFLKQAIDIAKWIGSDVMSFWSGMGLDGGPWMEWLSEGCHALNAHAMQQGVILAFEPEPGMFIDTMRQFSLLLEQVRHPMFALTLDVGHLHCLCEVPIAKHIHEWRNLLRNVHIEDMRRGKHDHLMFGEGEMDFAEVFTALNEIDYQGSVCVELSRHSYDAVETARKSLAFLRQFTTNRE